ncbi:MAG: hypothetical protein ACAI34_24380 [Verrucomicrobium sp.]|nr:hypothetical protein [Verrucomicrobium sp.]
MKTGKHAELRQMLEALNHVVHTSLSEGTQPAKEIAQRLVDAIVLLARNTPKLNAHVKILVGETQHLCDQGIQTRIRILNAIQAMFWALDAQPAPVYGSGSMSR